MVTSSRAILIQGLRNLGGAEASGERIHRATPRPAAAGGAMALARDDERWHGARHLARSQQMLPFRSQHAKSIALVGGFLFATLGALWSFLIVDRLSEQARELADKKGNVNHQIQSLNTLASEYFIANQQEI